MMCYSPASHSSLAWVTLQNYLYALLLVISPLGALAGQKQSPVLPTLLVKSVTAQVTRGEEVEIPIKVVPSYGGDVIIVISSPPISGSLEEINRRTASTPVLLYHHHREFKTAEDTFQYRVKSPGHAWNSYVGKILIKDPLGTLSVRPDHLDFGKVPLGCLAHKTLQLSNRFGASVSGTLLSSAPFSIAGVDSFTLAEGETKIFEVFFTPTETRIDAMDLKIAPDRPNIPLISVKGEGVAPFLVDHGSAILSADHPREDFRITNTTGITLTLECSRDPALICPAPIVIPAHGVGILSISMKEHFLPLGGSRSVQSLVSYRSYSVPLEIMAMGPLGGISIETLNGSQIILGVLGSPLLLKGCIRNTSNSNHEVKLAISSSQDGDPLSIKSLLVPASSTTPFEFSWNPVATGLCTPSVELLESGKVVEKASWKVSVGAPASRLSSVRPPISVPSLKVMPLTTEALHNRLATQNEKESLAIWMPPRFEDGLIRRSLVLRWRYLGSSTSQFVVTERVLRNSLSDRTGENPPESWNRIKGDPICHNGVWELKIPLPFPGTHSYMVYPNVQGEKIVSPLTIGISWSMFTWPALRLLLAGIFILSLVKVIRRRNWGRR